MYHIAGHTFDERVLGSNSIVIDIGGYHGAFSKAILDMYKCTVDCYEPNLENLLKISQAIHHDKFTVYPHAVAASSGMRPFFQPSPDSDGNSILEGHEAYDGSSENSSKSEVFAVSLTSIVRKYGTIDLVKMDCEGAEFEIIEKTSVEDLARIRQLTIEFHDFCFPQFDAEQIGRCIEKLKSAGFIEVYRDLADAGDYLFFNINWSG